MLQKLRRDHNGRFVKLLGQIRRGMMKKLLRNFNVKSWWSKTRWRTSSSPIKKMKQNCFNGVESQQYVICVTL
jgi:hypothetical protein